MPEKFSTSPRISGTEAAAAKVRRQAVGSSADLQHDCDGRLAIYARVIQPFAEIAEISVLKYELDTTDWNTTSLVMSRSTELQRLDYVAVKAIIGLKIAEEYRAAIEQKQIAEQQRLRAKTEVRRGTGGFKSNTLNKAFERRALQAFSG